jgi:hypothetical protein
MRLYNSQLRCRSVKKSANQTPTTITTIHTLLSAGNRNYFRPPVPFPVARGLKLPVRIGARGVDFILGFTNEDEHLID